MNHEFIEIKPEGQKALGYLPAFFAETRQTFGQLPPRTTNHRLFRSKYGKT